MKSAVKTALAFTHITGRIPIGIHLTTWNVVYQMIEDLPRYVKIDGMTVTLHDKRVKDEYLKDIEDHPFLIGHKLMTERGFKLRAYRQSKTSRNIVYYGPDDSEGYITREGTGCWIWTRNEKGGMATERFNLK